MTNNPNETPLTVAVAQEIAAEFFPAQSDWQHRELLARRIAAALTTTPAALDARERTNLARQIQQMYRERSQPLMTHEPPFESLLGLIVDAALTTTPAAPTSGAIAAAKEWFQQTRQAIEDERPRTSKSFTEAATANLDAAEQKLAAIISRHLPPEAPSISAAIAEVERLRDEWALGDSQSKAMVADEIMQRLKALQPSMQEKISK